MYSQLTEPERYTRSVLKREGCSLRSIARILQRNPSTISREIRRNATAVQGKPRALYVPQGAGACQWATHPQPTREAARTPRVCACRILAGAAAVESGADGPPTVGALGKHLRQGGKRRRKRTYGPERRGKLVNKPRDDRHAP